MEDRIDADLTLGLASELVADIETLVAEHPSRERLRAQLMLALYRSGRQAEALEVYRDADLNFNGKPEGEGRITYGDVFLQTEQEYSRFNFEFANTDALLRHFEDAEAECKALLAAGEADGRHALALPAYDQCIKASHVFNLLDARGVISVTARQSYILRVRELAKACCAAWLKTAGGGA